MSWGPNGDGDVATSLSVSDPWKRCLDSGLKPGERRAERGEEGERGGAVVVIKLSLPTLPPHPSPASYDPQHVQIGKAKSNAQGVQINLFP